MVQQAQQRGEDALDPDMIDNLRNMYQADIQFAYQDISLPAPLSLSEEMTYQPGGKKRKKRTDQQRLLARLDTYQS